MACEILIFYYSVGFVDVICFWSVICFCHERNCHD